MPKQTPTCNILNQVDLILFEEGIFSPLNWLLREGYLDYYDYQNWRNGKSEYLEDHFKKSSTELMTILEKIKDYLSSQQLDSVKHTYASTTSQSLYFCRSPAKELIFTTVYEPSQNRIQMDLFFDSASICTEFNLIEAVIDKRRDDIPDLLIKLKHSNPEKHQQFSQLLAFETKISQSKETNDRKIKLLQKITPLAYDTFGKFTYDFLTPIWHKLSIAIEDQYFNAETPECHLSFTAFKGFQWQQVLSSIERESNWLNHPVLIFRYAEACFKLNKEYKGIASWFRMFIMFPETAERLIGKTCNQLMLSDWQFFSELDPELKSSFFPAWLVMNKPALANKTDISDINTNESLQLIKNLVNNLENEINETTIYLRKCLQQNSPALFVHYMRICTSSGKT